MSNITEQPHFEPFRTWEYNPIGIIIFIIAIGLGLSILAVYIYLKYYKW